MKLAPSIYTADFTNLGGQIKEAERAGVDAIHLDIMDGNFVPNITFGPLVCAAVARSTSLPCEAHLMINGPERYFQDYRDAGVSRITVHVETCPHLYSTIQDLRRLGLQAGVTLNPLTPLEAIRETLPLVDLVLIMSVEPGYGGQKYIPLSTQRIATVRRWLDEIGSQAELEVDGGVNLHTICAVRDAGASIVVVGSAVFNDKYSVADSVGMLRASLQDCRAAVNNDITA
ncbi:MAG: ribulose-phosphate 3-epimerase [Chloroflexi bacterium]|nr:ribulose-phosphate 3-epimerase [Chloroflexota bacterium]MCL5273197.1 ribulose-phosphate 3-epimerase [Chloroflexota bacterium]